MEKESHIAETFRKGEVVCPKCKTDHEGFEYGADFIGNRGLEGIELYSCSECEFDFSISVRFLVKTLPNLTGETHNHHKL